MCAFLQKFFYFTYPIGWTELGVIATAAALIVAVIGIIKTQRQFKENMREQEKAIDVSLLDKRLEILEYFENDGASKRNVWDRLSENTDFTIERFRLLFSLKIISEYDTITVFRKKKDDLHYSRERAKAEAFSKKSDDPQDIVQDKEAFSKEFLGLEALIVQGSATEKQKKDFIALCSSSFSPDPHYYESLQRSSQLDKEIVEKTALLLQHMREEIQASVSDRGKKK